MEPNNAKQEKAHHSPSLSFFSLFKVTFVEQNLIVLSTDFPDSDDREKLDDYEHYSTTRVKFEIYGIDGVYKDKTRSTDRMLRLHLE
jgi:hypothetical protein